VAPVYERDKKTPVWVYIVGGCCGCLVLYVILSVLGGVALFSVSGKGGGLFGRARAAAVCVSHLGAINGALELYSTDNNGRLPPCDRWTDALDGTGGGPDYFGSPDVYHCPTDRSPYAYAMNSKFSGKKLAEVRKQGKEPLVYESTAGRANASDNVSSLPSPGRHGGKNNILCADGTIGSR
jgi:hypothetical protein